MRADPAASALFLGAFFDELERWGVHDVVVSPGSRSTPLAMTAYELSRRFPIVFGCSWTWTSAAPLI